VLNIRPVYSAVTALMDPISERYHLEIVFTDNHSTDGTFEEIAKISEGDPRVRGLRFSRNVGYQKSIETGYFRSNGDAAVQLDCDLQDPPALILEFIRYWEQGYKVVYGIRRDRSEGWLINAARKLFYRLVRALSEDDLPLDAGDFRLVDRQLLLELQKREDPQPYLRGSIAAMGFEQMGIPYARAARKLGESKFSFLGYVRFAMNGILNHSIVPLRIATYFGLTISILTFTLAMGYLAGKLILGKDWPAGFATSVFLQLASTSVTAMFLGIIGEYLARIYRQLKRPCTAIVEREVPFSETTENTNQGTA